MKKILSLIILCTMLFQGAVFASGTITSDVSGHMYEKAINVLRGLNIINGYEDGTFKPDNRIRRDEFVALIMRVLGYEDIPEITDSKFSDVDSQNWAARYINLACEMGIINGYSDALFKPSNEITFDEAVKVIVSAIGYKFDTTGDSNFAAKYVARAGQMGLLDDVNTSKQEITRGAVAQILYNALDVKVLEEKYETSGVKERREGDNTVLSNLGFEKRKGIVTGVFGATISGNSDNIKKDEIEIGGEKYKTDIFDVQNLIGLDVTYYTDDDKTDEKKVYCVEVNDRLIKDTVIKSSDILDSSTKDRICWTKEKKSYSRDIPQNAIILYNGYPLSTNQITKNIFDIESGTVTLRGNSSNKVDIVLIESYRTFVYVPSSNDRINDLFGDSIEYDTDDNKISYTFYRNGKEVEPSEYESNDILSVAVSLDGKYVKVIGISSSFEGEIVAADDEKYYIETEYGEKACEVTESYKRALESSNSYAEELKLDNTMIFYIDIMGDIAYTKLIKGSDDLKYGYLIDAEAPNGKIRSNFKIQVMTTDNEFKVFETKEKKILSGLTSGGQYSTKKRDVEEVANIIGSGEESRQVIQYALDKEGYLKEIYTADSKHSKQHLSKEQVFTGKYSNGLLDEYWYADENTVLFYVPNEKKYPELFKCSNALDELENDSTNNMTLYDIENLHVGAMVIEPVIDTYFLPEDGNEIVVDKLNSPVMVIEEILGTKNEDGENFNVIRGHVGSKYVEENIPEEYSSGIFHKGMVVQYETNDIVLERAYSSDYDKMISAYIILADLSKPDLESFISWNYSDIITHNAEICTSVGKVIRKDLPCVTLEVNKNGKATEIPYILNGGSSVMVYDREQKKVSMRTQEDISIGDVVFVRQRYNNIREFIIVK